ncbi:MAG: terpene cyclase/mutase family protein, partial [Planctomycetes bacterium]|nr:terpene cyclase/mutase family protein [Planctomycetota bacterium]
MNNYEHDELGENDDLYANADVGSDDDSGVKVAVLPAWFMSVAVHALLCVILMGIIIGQLPDEEPAPTQRFNISQEEIIEDDIVVEFIDPEIHDPVEDVRTDVSVDTDLVVDVQDIEFDETEDQSDIENEMQADAVAVTNTMSANAFMSIGAGSSGGPYSSRSGPNKKRAMKRFNAPVQCDDAVNAALRWFKKHQTTDGVNAGMWDVDGYMDNCQDNVKCEPGTAHTAAGGDGDAACTGYALLCYLGAGFDHKVPGRYKKTIIMAIEWLKKNQREDGGFGKAGRNYENAVCTKALCEVYAMTLDPKLKKPAQCAVDNLIQKQSKTADHPYGLAWNYQAGQATRNDSSVTGWCIMALKAAKSAGLDVGTSWDGAKTWVDLAWQASNPG